MFFGAVHEKWINYSSIHVLSIYRADDPAHQTEVSGSSLFNGVALHPILHTVSRIFAVSKASHLWNFSYDNT